MSLRNEVKSLLETTFDMPFAVEADYKYIEPYLLIKPDRRDSYLFTITVRFSNRIRMEVIVEPQNYAAQMVRDMGKADTEHKDTFCRFADDLMQDGGKIVFRVNEVSVEPNRTDLWPSDWEKAFLKVAVRPIEFFEYDKPDYIGTLNKWLPRIVGLSISLLNVVKIREEDGEIGQTEGKKYDVVTSKYERSPLNRMLCIAKYGYTCQVCGFDFEKEYGEIGRNFIHVHHIVPVSQMGEDYRVNPTEDLIPVCPNCHAMLHKENPPMSPARLREIIMQNKNMH